MNNFEIELINKLRNSVIPAIDGVFKFITNLGGQEILILIIITVYFIFSKKLGQRIAFTIFGSLLVNNSLKVLINRIRPFNHPNANYSVSDSVMSHATGMSFPSGHSQNSAVSYFAIAKTFNKKILWIISTVLVILIGLSRVVLGVHYLTDVIVGVILGLLFAIYGSKLHEKYENNFKMQMRLYLITALLFLPFIIIYINKVNTNYVGYKDLFTIYTFYLGYISAVYLEKRFVDFGEEMSLRFRIIRAVIAVFIVLGLLLGLKAVFPKDNIFFDMLRYFMLSFVGLGIYPILTKNLLFKKE